MELSRRVPMWFALLVGGLVVMTLFLTITLHSPKTAREELADALDRASVPATAILIEEGISSSVMFGEAADVTLTRTYAVIAIPQIVCDQLGSIIGPLGHGTFEGPSDLRTAIGVPQDYCSASGEVIETERDLFFRARVTSLDLDRFAPNEALLRPIPPSAQSVLDLQAST